MASTDLSLSLDKYAGAPHVSASVSSAARIPELDGLRGLAILLVILCHYVANAGHGELGFWPRHVISAFAAGWSGVDLFFVLSGFLIGGILLDARGSPKYFRAFYLRRVHRILPIYYLWISFYLVLICGALWLTPGQYTITRPELTQIPLQIFFLQNVHYGMPHFTWVWFAVTWSLAVEEQFYLVAPPLIRFVPLRKIIYILIATICLAPFLRFMLFHYWFPGTLAANFSMPCRADGLAWGILLAAAWRQEWFAALLEKHFLVVRWAVLGLFLGVCGLLWWLAHPVSTVTVTIGYSWLALFYGGLMILVLSQKGAWIAGAMRWKPLQKLGTISYCVYIIHSTFNHLAHEILLHADPEIQDAKGVAVTLLALMLTLAVASLSWRYFEKPLIRRGHSYEY